jgi:hypothetical protein
MVLFPTGHDPLSVRPPEQRLFDRALRKETTKMKALRRAITPWAGAFFEEVLESTIFHCGLYYNACLPHTLPRRSRAALKGNIKKAVALTKRLAEVLRALSSSRDPAMHRWLDPVLDASFEAHDALPRNLLDPGLVHALDELWRRLALLDQALPDDRGGNPRQLAFADLAVWLTGIYCSVTPSSRPSPLSTTGHFFRYAAAVVDLLNATTRRFPKARFDLPPNDEALRKALGRVLPRGPNPPGKSSRLCPPK